MNRDLAAGVDISYGPIKIGGGYAQHNEKKMHDVKIEKGTLTIRNLQIVAYICKPIGKCPEDPDKTAP
jgi:hypothetical protein